MIFVISQDRKKGMVLKRFTRVDTRVFINYKAEFDGELMGSYTDEAEATAVVEKIIEYIDWRGQSSGIFYMPKKGDLV